jgi:hypothetical protein
VFPWQLKYEIDESAIAHYAKVLRCQIYNYNQVEITHSIKVHLALRTRFQVVFNKEDFFPAVYLISAIFLLIKKNLKVAGHGSVQVQMYPL